MSSELNETPLDVFEQELIAVSFSTQFRFSRLFSVQSAVYKQNYSYYG